MPAADGARRGLARSDPQEKTGADKVAVGKQRMAGDDALQDREAPLDDDAPELQQRGGRQLVGRRGLALADALQPLLRRLQAPAHAGLLDRKGVGSGKRVDVRVARGGSRIRKKNKKRKN